MPGTDYRNGAGFQSRTAEFNGAISGNSGANYQVKQSPPPSAGGYMPSSVLDTASLGGSMNGQSPTTYNQNRTLNYYRQ